MKLSIIIVNYNVKYFLEQCLLSVLKACKGIDAEIIVVVKMLDGSGRFLPESKRGLPTPTVAFYKITGLSKLFPASKTFGKYHLGFLDKDQTHEVDVLAGAFMMLRKSVLDTTGLLDED